MSHEDFDLASLARYLHLAPPQVQKLVDRGHLPGRRVAGQWRFSPEEVHHWLEDRLGAGGESELSHVESVIEATRTALPVSIASLLSEEAIAMPLNARTRNSVIDSMVDLAMQTGLLWDAGKMADAVRARENLHSTALEIGVALLHPRRPMPQILGDSFIALGRTASGIPFGSETGRLTDVFFLLCSVDDATHLDVLARLSRLLRDQAFLDDLRSASTPAELLERVAAAEQRIDEGTK